MTIGEFKAWLDGYSEGKKGALSQKQLSRVLTKLSEVEENHSHCHHCYPWTITYRFDQTTPTVPTYPYDGTAVPTYPYGGTTISTPNITWGNVSTVLLSDTNGTTTVS